MVCTAAAVSDSILLDAIIIGNLIKHRIFIEQVGRLRAIKYSRALVTELLLYVGFRMPILSYEER